MGKLRYLLVFVALLVGCINERGENDRQNLMRCADEFEECHIEQAGKCRQKALLCRGLFSNDTEDLAVLFQSGELHTIAQNQEAEARAASRSQPGGKF